MKIISVQTMRDLDQQTIEAGTPGDLLMKRAGDGVFNQVRWFAQRLGRSHCRAVSVLAGKGNNGGDAYVVAMLLGRQTDIPTTVYSTCRVQDLQGDAKLYAQQLPHNVSVIVCRDELPVAALSKGTLLVDGLLGTGISGPLRSPYDKIITQINNSGLPVVAIDIPSGLDGESGEIASEAVQADLTVTMALPKTGLLSTLGMEHCGLLRCVDIGIPTALIDAAESRGVAVFADDIRPHLGRRRPDAHKGTFGSVLVIGGSRDYVGAPLMSGLAALRSGCGLAALAVPAGARQLMTQHPHALIVRSVPDGNAGWFTPDSIDELETIRSRAGVVALGPGFGLHKESAAVVERVLSWNLPVVVDADGLKLLAQIPNCLPRQAPTVLTPHPGEMRTLLDGFGLEDLKKESRTAQACGLAEKVQCHIVLKGLGTVVAAPDGAWSLNTSGTNALATGGTGDVLTGLIAGLLAQKMNISAACRTGVFMHGRAAEVAPIGSRALLADDLLDAIDGVFRELTPFY